jgi:hypothetical protein
MKLFKNITLLSVAFVLLLTGSCKKYPDGPLLSLHTKKQRLGGIWDVEYFSINGFDSTAYLKNQFFYGMYDFDVNHDSHDCYYRSTSLGYSLYGGWDFLNNNKDLKIGFVIDSSHKEQIGPYRSENVIWEIRRLSEKQLWLKTAYSDGREYFVKFKIFKRY